MSASFLLTCDHCPAAAAAAYDLAILGNGFFVVRNPANNKSYATQSGHFSLDARGYLVTHTGARVQGCTDDTLSTLGDIRINAPGFTMLSHSIDDQGKIIVHLSDGASFVRGQIMLQNFQDPQALVSEGNQLYSNLPNAGPLPALAAPGSNGLGAIAAGVLEFAGGDATNWNI